MAGPLAVVWGLLVWLNWYHFSYRLTGVDWLEHLHQSWLLFGYLQPGALGRAMVIHFGRLLLLGLMALAALGAGAASWTWLSGGRRGPTTGMVALGAGIGGLATLGAGLTGAAFAGPAWVAVALAAVTGLTPARGIRARWLLAPGARGWTLLIALALAASLGGSLAPETSIDAQQYHLAQPAVFAARHKVIVLPFNEFAQHPALTQMQFLLAILLSGGPALAKLVHWGWEVLVVAMLAGWAKPLLGAGWALAAAAGLALLPYVQVVSMRAYAEMATTAYMTLALWELCATTLHPVRLGVWCGLCAGTKFNGALAAGIASIALIGRRERPRTWLAFAAGGLGADAVWPARNWLGWGNPVAPFLAGTFPTLWWSHESMARHLRDFESVRREPYAPPGIGAWLARPWNVAVRNAGVMDPQSGMSGWFLWLIPLGLLGTVLDLGLLPGLLIIGAALWSLMPHLVRYSMPLWPAAALVAAAAARRLPVWPRAWAFGLTVLMLAHLPLAVSRQFSVANPFGVICGLETEEHYLARGFPQHGFAIAARVWLREQPDVRRVLLLTPTGFWLFFGADAVAQSLFDDPLSVRFASESRDAGEIARKFRQWGITHTLYEPLAGYSLQAAYGTWAFEDAAARRWREFWGTWVEPVHAEADHIVIHRFRRGPAGGPSPDGWLPGLDEQSLALAGAEEDRAVLGTPRAAVTLAALERLATDTGSAAAWEHVGLARWRRDDGPGALNAMRRAEQSGRQTVACFSVIAMQEARLGRRQAAFTALQRAVAIDPSRADLRGMLNGLATANP